MNFSTVPPWRSSSTRRREWYGPRTARTSSGSSCSAFAVNPTRSQKSTVTTLRSSCLDDGATTSSGFLQKPQNSNPSGFSLPQAGHKTMRASLPRRNQRCSYGRLMKTNAEKRTEAELQRQLILIESMQREGRSEREIVAALENG